MGKSDEELSVRPINKAGPPLRKDKPQLGVPAVELVVFKL